MRAYDPDRRKLLSAAAHGACLVGWAWVPLLVPIVILFVSEDPIVKDNAKESINFQINIIIYSIIFYALSFVLIGLPFLVLVAIASFILPIFAIVSVVTKPDRPYRYPLIFRFF